MRISFTTQHTLVLPPLFLISLFLCINFPGSYKRFLRYRKRILSYFSSKGEQRKNVLKLEFSSLRQFNTLNSWMQDHYFFTLTKPIFKKLRENSCYSLNFTEVWKSVQQNAITLKKNSWNQLFSNIHTYLVKTLIWRKKRDRVTYSVLTLVMTMTTDKI